MAHKKKQATCSEVFVHEGQAYTAIHKDESNAWIVPYNIQKKHVGGGVKKVTRDFLDSQKFAIFVSKK
jgi:hypothetical protein